MAKQLIHFFKENLTKLENRVLTAIFNKFHPGLCAITFDNEKPTTNISIKNIWEEGILWGVPKHRRPIEKRLSRKFGIPGYNYKPLVVKTNIKTCNACGHYHEIYTICGHCYQKVKDATEQMKPYVEKKLDSVMNDIIALYKTDASLQNKIDEKLKKEEITEAPKKQPSWFHQNLLESSTQKFTEKKGIRPEDLK